MHSRTPLMRSSLAARLPVIALAAFAALTCAAAMVQAAADSPVGRIDGRPIPYSELSSRTQGTLARQQQDYESQLQRLNLGVARARSKELEGELDKLVDERVLALESAARKSTTTALLNAVKTPARTEAELHTFYDSQRPRLNQSFETVKLQIDEYLRGEATEEAQQGYLQTLREKYHAVLTWEPLREQVEASGPQRGPADARITIVEFSDFQCPYCGRLAPILRQLQETHPSEVRLVFRNLPLRTMHPNAATAAQAGVCANAQGKFWEMHDTMYANQNLLGEAALKEAALRLGLDAKAFNDCMESAQGAAAIAADEAAAERLGLSGTPNSFVNGRFVNGTMSLYKWQALIDDELRRTAAK